MLFAESVPTDLFRAVLQGGPPGAVYALVALGFALTYKRDPARVRGSEVAAESVGISPGRARLVAFTVSGIIAGLGGAFLAMHQENVNYTGNFTPFAALFWLVIVATRGPEYQCVPLLRVEDSSFEMVADPKNPFICWPGRTLAWSEPQEISFQ